MGGVEQASGSMGDEGRGVTGTWCGVQVGVWAKCTVHQRLV